MAAENEHLAVVQWLYSQRTGDIGSVRLTHGVQGSPGCGEVAPSYGASRRVRNPVWVLLMLEAPENFRKCINQKCLPGYYT